MAHLSEGTLRRKFDDEAALTDSDARHYAACPDCQARYAVVADDARAVAGVLSAPDLKVDVASAFDRVRSAPAAQPRFGFRMPMLLPASRRAMGVLAAATLIIALVVTAGVAQVIFFQPQTIKPIPVSMADLQSLSGLTEYGTFEWTTKPQPQLVTSATEAATVSGLAVPVVTVPSTVSTTITYAAMPKAVGVFTFDAATAAASAAKAGKQLPAMPSGMDGSKLTVTIGPAVIEVFGTLNTGAASDVTQLNLPQLVVAESTAPSVATSSGITTRDFEDYLLAQPGVSPKLAEAIRSIKDPSTTLPIPIPVEYATSGTVTVQDVEGLSLGDNTGLGAGVIWIKNGTVYGVAGTLHKNQILDVANSLH